MTRPLLRFLDLAFILLLLLGSCGEGAPDRPDAGFTRLSPAQTGLDFRNDLAFEREFNIYRYRNFYNGGGVAIGDVNGDTLPDVYLTGNMLPNRLYLNIGDFKFEDVTDVAGVGGDHGWSTGVTMADVNADGLLDIYVANSGKAAGDTRANELFINLGPGPDGVPPFCRQGSRTRLGRSRAYHPRGFLRLRSGWRSGCLFT